MQMLDKIPDQLAKRLAQSSKRLIPFHCDSCKVSFAWEPFTDDARKHTVISPCCRVAEEHPEIETWGQ